MSTLHPAGRPLTYQPAFCEAVIELGKQGKSLAYMAGSLGVTRECVYEWMRNYPEFSDAMSVARLYSQQWWEDAGQNALYAAGFNTGVWAKSMSCRFPDDWRDQSKTELTGTVTTIQKIERPVLDPQ